MTYNPSILAEVMRARSLSASALSKRLGLSIDSLREELDRDPEPTQKLLNSIAKELALPAFVFFMQKTPSIGEIIPDFRSAHPVPSPKYPATIQKIQLAATIQKAAAQLVRSGASNLPSLNPKTTQEIEELAFNARQYFRISLDDQLAASDARAFYNICRKKIEDKGIFVLQESFPPEDGSGFCLAHPTHPVIVINTKRQTRGRRLFTLVHELGHVLLQATGISDPFERHNPTEKLCNMFASAFLIPAHLLSGLLNGMSLTKEPDVEDVRRAAKRTKISQQATVLRLEELGTFRQGSHERWLKAVHNLGNPDYSEKGGGVGGPPPQEKVKLAKYGFRLASAFAKPLQRGQITDIELFRTTGLKPKYQLKYIEYAQSLSDLELRTLELGDD